MVTDPNSESPDFATYLSGVGLGGDQTVESATRRGVVEEHFVENPTTGIDSRSGIGRSLLPTAASDKSSPSRRSETSQRPFPGTDNATSTPTLRIEVAVGLDGQVVSFATDGDPSTPSVLGRENGL